MGSTIDEEVVGYPSITLPYSVAASCVASKRLERGGGFGPSGREAAGVRREVGRGGVIRRLSGE